MGKFYLFNWSVADQRGVWGLVGGIYTWYFIVAIWAGSRPVDLGSSLRGFWSETSCSCALFHCGYYVLRYGYC